MADNYLERKMEEHARSGAAPALRRSASPQAGKAVFNFPPRRILIAGDDDTARAVAETFVRTGSKVAVMSAEKERGSALADSLGLRLCSALPDLCQKNIGALLETWRGLDILIVTDPGLPVADIIGGWEHYRSRFNIPDSYTPRVIIACDGGIPTVHAPMTANSIGTEGLPPALTAEFCLFLALPAASFLNRATIR